MLHFASPFGLVYFFVFSSHPPCFCAASLALRGTSPITSDTLLWRVSSLGAGSLGQNLLCVHPGPAEFNNNNNNNEDYLYSAQSLKRL